MSSTLPKGFRDEAHRPLVGAGGKNVLRIGRPDEPSTRRYEVGAILHHTEGNHPVATFEVVEILENTEKVVRYRAKLFSTMYTGQLGVGKEYEIVYVKGTTSSAQHYIVI